LHQNIITNEKATSFLLVSSVVSSAGLLAVFLLQATKSIVDKAKVKIDFENFIL
jgi:hypothetical protein